MPKKPDDETESAPKRNILLWVGLCIGLVLVSSVLTAGLLIHGSNCTEKYQDSGITDMRGKSLKTQIANNDASREKGLSGKACIEADQAMLFTFDKPGQYCFWMKDMRFPIDMVWLDKDKKVTTIHTDVSPSTYPSSFCPDGDAQYVLELQAGASKQAELTIGDTVTLPGK